MTPLCKIEVTLPRVLGSREVRRGGGVDEHAGDRAPRGVAAHAGAQATESSRGGTGLRHVGLLSEATGKIGLRKLQILAQFLVGDAFVDDLVEVGRVEIVLGARP